MGRNNHISDLFFIKQSSASVLEEKFIKFKAQGENCHSKWKRNSKELLAEIKRYMDLNDISIKELAINMGKSQQSVSQYFNNGNPRLDNLFDIAKGLNVSFDFTISQEHK